MYAQSKEVALVESSTHTEVEKFTDIALMQEANTFTTGKDSSMGLALAYHMEHSPIRTQFFAIRMYDIYTKVSVHLIRHSAGGQQHYVRSKRDGDWLDAISYDHEVNRLTPVDHMMILNAQHLIDMSRKRLCSAADRHTVLVMQKIKDKVREIDPALARYMQPNCVYRGGCYEGKRCCGFMPAAKLRLPEDTLNDETL